MQCSLKILVAMLAKADRISAWSANELSEELSAPLSTIYHNVRTLISADLIVLTSTGYVLSKLVLGAGISYTTAIAKISVQNKEQIYGQRK